MVVVGMVGEMCLPFLEDFVLSEDVMMMRTGL